MDRLPDHTGFPLAAHPSGRTSQLPPQQLIAILERALHDVAALPPTVSPVVALVQRALADFERLQSADRLTAISDHVARRLGVTYERLSSKSRTQHLAYCRHVAMYVCRSLAGASYTAVGIHFQRNHSTAYWAIRLVTTRMARDAGFRRAIENIERELTSTTATVAAAA
jgi:chromosomal replication initiation ATPase DnaA